MGLDAFVQCSCWREGKTTPPPFPRDLLAEDEEGNLGLAAPHDDDFKLYTAFRRWRESACAHPHFKLIDEHVSNWGGYRVFQGALGEAGWERFPILRAELPEGNGGQVRAELSRGALAELRSFREIADLGESVFLINGETGDALYEYIAAYEGVFAWGGKAGVELGVDADGFFIRKARAGRETPPLFRSRQFAQVLLDPVPTNEPYGGMVEFVARDSDQRLRIASSVSGKDIPWPDGRMENGQGQICHEYPRELRVEQRRTTAEKFNYILDPLTTLFEASAASGNPVQWT